MDIEKLIEQLKAWNEQHLSVVCGSGHFTCDYLCENEDCIVVRAATALSTLQEENEKQSKHIVWLNDKLEIYQNKVVPEWRAENEKLRAELEKVKSERDAAVSDLETVMAYGGGNLDTCTFCKNGQCYGRGGTKLCDPEWRGPQKED